MSARNWSGFSEALGVPQVPILPFGTQVEARKRSRSGYKFQWLPRTTRGSYLGPAPHTSGGHLVLIRDDDDATRKVLLTSTVYPVRDNDDASVKPKYRLTTKRSPADPRFAIRVAAAVVIEQEGSTSVDSRLPPGGESLSEFWQRDGPLFRVQDFFLQGDSGESFCEADSESSLRWEPSLPLWDLGLG